MEAENDGEDARMGGPGFAPRAETVDMRADEIDAANGSPDEVIPLDELAERLSIQPDPELEVAGAALEPGASGLAATGTVRSPVRPILRREGSAPPPPPPRQPPPPAPPAQMDGTELPTDSLSLGQLRNIVANFPRLEPVAYAYTYEDTRSFPEELEEWFQYTQEDRSILEESAAAFERRLRGFSSRRKKHVRQWLELSENEQLDFIRGIVDELSLEGAPSCLESLLCLAYLAMGVWNETATKSAQPSPEDEYNFEPPNQKYLSTVAQLNCINRTARLMCQVATLSKLYEIVRHICDCGTFYDSAHTKNKFTPGNGEKHSHELLKIQQLNAALTTMYFVIESGRHRLRRYGDGAIREALSCLDPCILNYLSQLIAKIRWSDDSEIPFTKILLLLWKSSLLIFGDGVALQACKESRSKDSDQDKSTMLYASPLDYHVFRQEITSKYPAYNPPPPIIPLEANNNSILPPQKGLEGRSQSQDDLRGLGIDEVSQPSIFNQPVHIATPAPSPPPSPAGPGGKGGKKQNYQTNQNFPFLYPPLDSSSNNLGGKGKTELQDKLVGKRWEGADVPASIVEAGQLFASRMRMSRALKQLWKVREDFIRFERGWEQDVRPEDESILHIDPTLATETQSTASSSSSSEEGLLSESTDDPDPKAEPGLRVEDNDTLERLDKIESYFKRLVLPQLQSMIIVLLKILLSNVTILGNLHPQPANGMPAATEIDDSPEDKPLPKANLNLSKQLVGASTGQPEPEYDPHSYDELNSVRTREVTSKAVCGFLLTLLKWFRFSHVLKFEYTTQLMLDSNYVPLALKYFALQDIDKAVDLKHDQPELEFFHVCRQLSGALDSACSSPDPRPTSSSSIDSAAPPPIARHRPSLTSPVSSSPPPSPGSPGSPQQRPEVDELGYPTTSLPYQPLTTYSPRFFFTYITMLRLLQKLTKGHAHRALLLVQYKSSTILRKSLKIPQPSLRLYTLKLFKTQVPFCGRKWRQANMRVITAIYVFCRMGLRDEWISGGGQVEELVEGAIGTESAWRGLTGWWLAREYREALLGKKTGSSSGVNMEELMVMARGGPGSGVFGANCGEDFFARELEKMGWGFGSEAIEDEEGEWGDWDGGPLELDGW